MADTALFDVQLGEALKRQAREAADALQATRDEMRALGDNVEAYRAQLKQLRSQEGDTSKQQAEYLQKLKDSRKALTDLRATANTHRDTLEAVRKKQKELSAESKASVEGTKAMRVALKSVGGPVQELREQLATLKEAFGGGNAGAVLFAGGAALLVAGIAALSATVVGALASFGRWAIGTADAARSLGLLQEAAAGSAENSAAMTSQIDAMARKVPTTRDELQKLYQETYRLANHSRLSGQAIQDTYEAIARSSAAMNDAVGKQIGDLILRSKDLGVVRITPQDLVGTGLDYEKDLVEPLAKSMAKLGPITHDELAKARSQLQISGFKGDAGAKLLVDAVNHAFGGINTRQMLALHVQWSKLKDLFVGFTRGINLDPLLHAVQHLFALFQPEQEIGDALKTIVDVLGNGMVGAAAKGGPALEDFFKDVLADVENFMADVIRGKSAFSDMFKIDVGDVITDLRQVVELIKDAAQAIRVVNNARNGIADTVVSIANAGNHQDTTHLEYQAQQYAAGHAARMAAKSGASSSADPTVVTSPAHATGGVVGKPAPGEFWASVAPGETIVPAGKSKGSSGGGTVSGKVTVELVVRSEGAPAAAIVKAMQESSFLEQLTDTLEVAFGGMGIETGAVS